MTREEQRQLKAHRQAVKLADKLEKRRQKQMDKVWENFEKKMKEKGAWIEEPKEDEKLNY